MSRGYFGIGIAAGKSPVNVGTLMRSAQSLGAAFVFTAGHRYPKQPSDTTKTWRHLPAYELDSVNDLPAWMPKDCALIGVECGEQYRTKPLTAFKHPERAVYVLGAEDRGLPVDFAQACDALVEIPGDYCLNVAVAGSILMYDRVAKA